MSLSQGAIQNIISGAMAPNSAQPTMHVTNIKSTKKGKRLFTLNDGTAKTIILIASSMVPGDIAAGALIKVTNWSTGTNQKGETFIVGNEVQMVGHRPVPADGLASGAGPVGAAAVSQQPPRAPHPQPQRVYGGGGAGGGGGGATSSAANNMPTIPIKALNPYQQKWNIKVRVTKKSDQRTWSNARGEGKLFSIEMLDAQGDEIRGTFFKEDVDRFWNVLHEGQTYIVSGGRLKVANRKYTTVDNQFEISFGRETQIFPIQDEGAIKNLQITPVRISALENKKAKDNVDILGIVTEVDEVRRITTRAGKEAVKRDITIVDVSSASVRCTLWGKHAKEDDANAYQGNPTIALKGASVSEWGGRTLSTYNSTRVELHPDVAGVEELKAWFATNGGDAANTKKLSGTGGSGTSKFTEAIQDVTKRGCLGDIRANNLGMSLDRADWMSCYGKVMSVLTSQSKKVAYPSHPVTKKKLVYNGGGEYMDNASGETMEPMWRWILRLKVQDHSGSRIVTFFHDEAQKIAGKLTATEMQEAGGTEDGGGDEVAFKKMEETFVGRNVMMNMRLQGNEYEGNVSCRCTGTSVEIVDYAKESQALIAAIKTF